MRLKGKVVVITGATRGLGREIALALAEEGARLVLSGRNMSDLESVASEIRVDGLDPLIVRADLMKPGDVESLANAALQSAEGRVDVLVNAAGVAARNPRPIWEQTEEDFRAFFDTNVMGVFLTMKFIIPIMIKQRSGKIVNIGGTFGHKGVEGVSLYGSSKWALRGLTKSVALEAGPYGINVNCIAPGGIQGPSFESWLCDEAGRLDLPLEEMRARFLSPTALRKMSTNRNIADAVIFLASDESALITGQDLLVDGGTIV